MNDLVSKTLLNMLSNQSLVKSEKAILETIKLSKKLNLTNQLEKRFGQYVHNNFYPSYKIGGDLKEFSEDHRFGVKHDYRLFKGYKDVVCELHARQPYDYSLLVNDTEARIERSYFDNKAHAQEISSVCLAAMAYTKSALDVLPETAQAFGCNFKIFIIGFDGNDFTFNPHIAVSSTGTVRKLYAKRKG